MAQGEFLEYAEVYDNRYGVPKNQVRRSLARGQDVLIKVDVQGAATIRELAPQAVFIFLAPPSMEELTRRLRSRKTEDIDELLRRVRTAERALRFDSLSRATSAVVGTTVARPGTVAPPGAPPRPATAVRLATGPVLGSAHSGALRRRL